MKIWLHPSVQPALEAIAARPAGTFLLHGARSVGKRTVALDIARRANCRGCSDQSCRSCKMVAGGNHPNVLRISPDEKGKIGIESVHDLQGSLKYERYDAAGRQVVIVGNADTLTLPAQHALLKTLEEPPIGTLILLTARTPAALLPTVISRCTQLFMPLLSSAEIAAAVRELLPEQSGIADDVAALSGGAVGRAFALAQDPALYDEERMREQRIQKLMTTSGLFDRLRLAAEIAGENGAQQEYADGITQQARRLARSHPGAGLMALQAADSLRNRLRANVVPKAAFEAFALELV